MKQVIMGFLLMMLVLPSLISAASSEVSMDFGVKVPQKEVINYVPLESSTWDYFGYFILIVAILIVAYFIFNKKTSKKKRSRKNKSVKKKIQKKKK